MTETATTSTLSAQEAAIEGGKQVMHGTVTDQVLQMYEAIRANGPPRVSLDRAMLFTASFKDTEGHRIAWEAEPQQGPWWRMIQNCLAPLMYRHRPRRKHAGCVHVPPVSTRLLPGASSLVAP